MGNYGEVTAEFRDTWLAQRAAAMPNRLALRTGGVDLTYADLEREASAAAERLREEGAAEGALISLEMPPSADFVAHLHAAAKLGAVAAPARQGSAAPPPPDEGQTSASTSPGAYSRTFERCQTPDALCRLYTSGTTGQPRAVDLTTANFFHSAVGTAFALGLSPADRWLCCLPLHHVGGLSILTRAATCGFGAVLHDGFDVDRVGASFAEDEVTLVSLVTTQLIRLLEADVDLTGPRALAIGGGPVPIDVIEEATGRGATVIQVYGMTETTSQVTLLETADAQRKAGSAGRALLGAELRTDQGEILVRGAVVAPGSAGADGWLRTGDLGSIDSEGYLWVDGRRDDLIVTGGENVMPERVEDVLKAHPNVADAAVVGRPDPEWQEAVTAVVVLTPGAHEDAVSLRAHCAQELAGYEVPKSFVFVADLPRTASGKLMRSVLR
ncbi:MAG: o-succinylbenzoate---CoA ligase [Solirubrobacterales bacterium]|nr:o-succinylbenzoate---CoA ligase [Solirubrobacterales bacterium]